VDLAKQDQFKLMVTQARNTKHRRTAKNNQAKQSKSEAEKKWQKITKNGHADKFN